jgi:peptide deformylase
MVSSESLEISYTNLCGENEVLTVDGSLGEHEKWLSRCIQHEYDHLEGILYTDRLGSTSSGRYHEEYHS